jgi:ribosomal protein S18 acetylase RimI-like enzyme
MPRRQLQLQLLLLICCSCSGWGTGAAIRSATRCSHPCLRCTATGIEESVPPLTPVPLLPSFGKGLHAGLPSAAHLPDIALLLVNCFYSTNALPASATGSESAALFGGGGSEADEELPDSLRDAPAALQHRFRMTAKGLQWRLGARLDRPDLEASLETSLLIALQDADRSIVACAELALRPTDGRLPGEFAVPPLFLLHADAPLGGYLSNLAVAPSHRRRGLGSQLLGACERLVREQWGYAALHLHMEETNAAAAQLYRRQGYILLPEYDDMCQPVPRISADGGPTTPVINRYHRKMLY